MTLRSLLVELVEVDGKIMATAPWLPEPLVGEAGETGDQVFQRALAARFTPLADAE